MMNYILTSFKIFNQYFGLENLFMLLSIAAINSSGVLNFLEQLKI